MITIASVLRSGGIYTPWHVDRLRGMVAANMTSPHRFVCLSDIDVPCDRIPLTQDWPGWWSKIELWKPGRFSGRVLYLDLDSTVIGSLDDLANYPAPFVIVENFKEIKEPIKARFNSSIIAFDAEHDAVNDLFTNFTTSVMSRLPGDQDWISEQLPRTQTFPKDWCVSYKVRRYAKLKTLPRDARVVCYHGKPKPFDLPDNDLDGFQII